MRPFQMRLVILLLLLAVAPLLFLFGVRLSSNSLWLMLGCLVFYLVGRRLLIRRLKKLAESPEAATWSLFRSPEIRDICAHLTPEEIDELASQAAQVGRKIGALMSLPLVVVGFSLLYSVRVFAVLLGLFIGSAFVIEWRLIRDHQRRVRRTLCATEYAKARGYHPETLRMFSFPWFRKAPAGDPRQHD